MEIKDCFLAGQRLGYTCEQHSLHDMTITLYKDGDAQCGQFFVSILHADKEFNAVTLSINHEVHTVLLDQVKPHTNEVRVLPLDELVRCIVFTDSKVAKAFQQNSIAPATKADAHDFLSPLSGRIVQVLVKPGDYVTPESPLLVVESMKMENILYASRDAFVKNLFIGVGDVVKKYQRLITFKVSGEVYGTLEAPGK